MSDYKSDGHVAAKWQSDTIIYSFATDYSHVCFRPKAEVRQLPKRTLAKLVGGRLLNAISSGFQRGPLQRCKEAHRL